MKPSWFAAVLALLLACVAPAAQALPFTGLYVIGDSLSDQGNLKAATTAIAGPASSLPASDHYFAGRFSNGPVYTDFLSQRLGLPLLPTLAGGTNFAFGGARTDYNIVEMQAGGPLPNGLFPWSLRGQIDAFRAASIVDPGALYIVLSGANDVADILRAGLNPGVVIPNAVGAIVDAVGAFKDSGARHIVVGNVADLGLTPAFTGAGPAVAGAATALSAGFNALLAAQLATITGVDIIELDVFGFVQDLVLNPTAAGLTNVMQPCYSGFVEPNPAGVECSNPDEFLFWDVVHPTSAVHALLAQQLLTQLPEPSTLALALPLLAWLSIARMRASRDKIKAS
jgi:phospholipase/lecithinase/hemolysin